MLPEPMVFGPTPHGIFPSYGFDQNDSERITPILNLLHSGAYRIDEEDIGWNKSKVSNSKTFFEISLSPNGDTICTNEYYYKDGGDPYLAFRQRYLRNGKEIYFWSTDHHGGTSVLL